MLEILLYNQQFKFLLSELYLNKYNWNLYVELNLILPGGVSSSQV